MNSLTSLAHSDGRAVAAILLLALGVSACNSSTPTAPTPPPGPPAVALPPDYSGTWTGTYLITGCSGHYDPRSCGRMMFSVSTGLPQPYEFTLTLAQTGAQVTGTLDDHRPFTIPVTGIVRESGVLVLEASVQRPDLEPYQITNWSSALNAAASRMSGAFTRFESGIGLGFTRYRLRTEHEFADISRSQ